MTLQAIYDDRYYCIETEDRSKYGAELPLSMSIYVRQC